MPEAAIDSLRRNASMQPGPGPLQRQGLGEHDFFGQVKQQYDSRLGNGDGHVQSQNILLGAPNPDHLGAGNMRMEYAPGGKIQSSYSGMPSGNAGSSSPPVHAAHSSAGAFVDDRRNQVPTMQQYSSDSQNTSSKFSNFLPMNIGNFEHRSNANDMANASGLHNQNQYQRYASQNPAGAATNETSIGTFPTNQLPNGPAGGPTRFGMTQLQLLRQQALQSKQQQALQSKQQQAMRLQQQEAMRAQQEEATRQQQEAKKMQQELAIKAQKQEAMRMQQQQEAVRFQQQQEAMQSQQQENLRMQQRALYLQQQGAARPQEQNPVVWSQEHHGVHSMQQDTVPCQQQQALQSQQQKAVWSQHESEQKKGLQSQQQRAWQSQLQQTFLPYQQQASPSNQHQALQFHQRRALQSQQQHISQNQQQVLGSQQQHLMRSQQQTLQTQQQQAPQSQQKHVFSPQDLTLQSQQEFFEAQQVVSQETCAEFPGTSYSALLHGPDTPPSHPQSGGDTSLPDLEIISAAFSPAKTQTVVWPTYGSSYYHGLPTEPSMSQNTAESQNLRRALHLCDDHNSALAEDQGRRSFLSEYSSAGPRAPSPVKPAFQANKQGNGDAEMGGFGFIDDSTFNVGSRHQTHAKPLVQTSHYMGEQSVRPNGLSNGPIQTNLLSQSQQHFQGLQSTQHRSWERLEQKHGVSKPSFSEVHPSLSQGMPSIDRSTMQSGFQQKLSSIGAGRGSPGHDSQQVGSTNPDATNMDEEERQCSNWQSVMRLHTGQDTGEHSRQISDTKNDSWGNHMVQTPVHSVVPSEGTSQAMLSVNQWTLLDMQVPPKITTVRNPLSNQENFVWKENDISRQITSYYSEPDGYFQGTGKRHASFQESGGLDITSEPSNRGVNGSMWRHKPQPDKPISDAQFNVQAASLIPNSHRGQDNAGLQMHEKHFTGHEGISQQVHNGCSLNGVGSQHISSTVGAPSQVTATSNREFRQVHRLNTAIELQGSAVGQHRILELPMDPSSRNVSLAHLRQSQPSSPLSPQHVQLGLGPADLPQNIQQAANASTQTSFQIDGSYRRDNGPSSNMEGKNFLAGMPQGGSDYESPAGSRRDLNQGIGASLNGMLLQNNARPSSALSNSSSFSRESADSEALPPASLPHGVKGAVISQGIPSLKGNSLYGAGTKGSYFEEESSLTLHGKLNPAADYSKHPAHVAGNKQGKFSAGPVHAHMDAGSLRVLQNQQIINMALKQLGNKAQAANLAGLLTTLKTSLSEHSKNSGDGEKLLPAILESDRAPSGSAREDGNVSQLMHSPQRTLVNPGHVREDCSPHLRAGSFGVSNEYTYNPRFKQEEGSGSATTSLLLDLQRQSRQLNVSRSHSSQPGEQQARHSDLRTLIPVPLQGEIQARDSDAQPAIIGQAQYLQQQNTTMDGLSLNQASKGPMATAAHSARLPKDLNAVDEPNEAQLKPFKISPIHAYLGKVTPGQRDGTFAEEQDHKSAVELEKFQQQKASVSNFVSQSSQSADSSPSRHGQLSKQFAANASSLPCTDIGVDVHLANDAEPLHRIRLHSDISSDQVLYSHEPTQENSRNSLHNPLVNESAQPVAHIDRDLRLSTGQGDSGIKGEDARMKGHIATSNRFTPRQDSPSNISFLGPSTIHPKKRKKPVPLLIPWYISATQPRDSLPSTSEMELMWANTANRLSDKDDADVRKENVSSSIKAKRRLRLTTQLVQQLIPPLPVELMHGNTPVDNECATFSLTKFALEDACRLVTNTRREASSAHDRSENKNMLSHGEQGRTWGMAKSVAVTRCVESFTERAKGLESELARIESSTSASDLQREICDLEKVAIVNRLAKHHGSRFSVEPSEFCLVENITDVNAGTSKPSLTRYVTPAPMPRTLPGVKCLSL